jgi:wobble nucleotide-excising tRNase
MLERFRFIGNIGHFREIEAGNTRAMEALTLVCSENGRGMTTLCAILRSLSSGKPDPILERSRLSATDPSRAVVEFDGNSASFDGVAWNRPGPRVVVLDEHFVDANVHSGLAVAASHRQNLHELVLGEEGGRYLNRVLELESQADEAQRTLR